MINIEGERRKKSWMQSCRYLTCECIRWVLDEDGEVTKKSCGLRQNFLIKLGGKLVQMSRVAIYSSSSPCRFLRVIARWIYFLTFSFGARKPKWSFCICSLENCQLRRIAARSQSLIVLLHILLAKRGTMALKEWVHLHWGKGRKKLNKAHFLLPCKTVHILRV